MDLVLVLAVLVLVLVLVLFVMVGGECLFRQLLGVGPFDKQRHGAGPQPLMAGWYATPNREPSFGNRPSRPVPRKRWARAVGLRFVTFGGSPSTSSRLRHQALPARCR